MSEKLSPASPEKAPGSHLEKAAAQHAEKSSQQAAESRPLDVEKARQAAENQAISGKEMAKVEDESNVDHSKVGSLSLRQLKAQTYQKTLTRVRSKLSPEARVASRIIHQPIVDKVSTISSQTVFRPLSLMVGGIVALLGSAGLLWASKHYGFSYNYFVIILLFGFGWLIGLALELSSRPFKKKH